MTLSSTSNSIGSPMLARSSIVLGLESEAYHLEASNFSLYVGNNAGVFQPTNQNHRIFFCPNMESAD